MQEIIAIRYSSSVIVERREQIGRQLLNSSAHIISADFQRISPADLELMFQLYDQYFFDGWIAKHMAGRLQFSISRKMTRSAGKTMCSKNTLPENRLIEVRISLPIIANYGLVEDCDRVGGIKCSSRLEALQLIFEHELIHVLEFIAWGTSSCSQSRFKTMAANIFGHQASHHQLPTDKEIARRKLGLGPGSVVTFEFDGALLRGIIYSVRKRACVMVADPKGSYHDHQGNRYSKYLVPLPLLRLLD